MLRFKRKFVERGPVKSFEFAREVFRLSQEGWEIFEGDEFGVWMVREMV